MTNDPYADLRSDDTSPDAKFAKQLNELAIKLQEAEADILEKELALKAAQKRHRELSENIIPSVMGDTVKYQTVDGLEVEVIKKIRHSLPAERRERGYDWLEKNKHGSLVKRTVVVAFNIDQQQAANDLMERLRDEFPTTKQERKVESATLGAFIKRALDRKEDIPVDLFWYP